MQREIALQCERVCVSGATDSSGISTDVLVTAPFVTFVPFYSNNLHPFVLEQKGTKATKKRL